MKDQDVRPAWDDAELQECLRLYGFTLHPAAAIAPPMNATEFDELMRSADNIGWLAPVVIDSSDRLVDGRNRLVASCRISKDAPVVVEDHADPIAFVLATRARSNMTASQKGLMVARAMDMYAEQARLRQSQAVTRGNRTRHGAQSPVSAPGASACSSTATSSSSRTWTPDASR
jgi:hypothetical protein